MRYLILCLLALTSTVHTFAQSVTTQSNTNPQSIEADGTLLTTSLGLPYDLLSLPLFQLLNWHPFFLARLLSADDDA